MKSKRKRKLIKLIKSHATPLLESYFNNEHALAVSGRSTISSIKELEITHTIHHYAEMLLRNFKENDPILKERWVKLILDFV